MNKDDLQTLLGDLAAGLPVERVTLDLKRKWWEFSQTGDRDKFLKVVAGLANSLSGAPRRFIVVGVDEQGRVHDAPPPEDEAKLQQRLDAIEPRPTVGLEVHKVDGKRVSILTVSEPFDRPYVTKEGARHFVFLRMGSETTTAARRHLDRMYASKRREARLRVGWGADQGGAIDWETPPSLRSPAFSDLREVHDTFNAEVEEAQEQMRLLLGFTRFASARGTVEAAFSDYATRVERFLEDIGDTGTLRQWHAGEQGANEATAVCFRVENIGSAKAMSVKLEVTLPDWLYAFEREEDLWRITVPLAPKAPAFRLIAERALNPDLKAPKVRGLPFAAAHVPFTPSAETRLAAQIAAVTAEPQPHAWTDEAAVGVFVGTLHRDHSIVVDDLVHLIAAPGAPAGEVELEGALFDEEHGWSPVSFPLRIGAL